MSVTIRDKDVSLVPDDDGGVVKLELDPSNIFNRGDDP